MRLFLLCAGICLIALIIADGVRRIRKQQKFNEEVIPQDNAADDEADPLFFKEESEVVIKSKAEAELALTTADEDDIISATEFKRREPMPEVVILNVMARGDSLFDGPNVLQALLSLGLRHGDMAIFHRHDNLSKPNEVQFSVASAVEPGTFDLDAMGSFETPGLSLFCAPPEVKDPLHAFDLMLETAEKLADRLGGELLNGRRQDLEQAEVDALRTSLGAGSETLSQTS